MNTGHIEFFCYAFVFIFSANVCSVPALTLCYMLRIQWWKQCLVSGLQEAKGIQSVVESKTLKYLSGQYINHSNINVHIGILEGLMKNSHGRLCLSRWDQEHILGKDDLQIFSLET